MLLSLIDKHLEYIASDLRLPMHYSLADLVKVVGGSKKMCKYCVNFSEEQENLLEAVALDSRQSPIASPINGMS